MNYVPMPELREFTNRQTADAVLRVLECMGAPAIKIKGKGGTIIRLSQSWWDNFHAGLIPRATVTILANSAPQVQTWAINMEPKNGAQTQKRRSAAATSARA
jgi:hypothetical protein